MKRILLIPDKFKGSLSAKEICRIMHEELQHFDSSLKFINSPMADGGDGTLDILKDKLSLELLMLDVVDPLMRPTSAYYYFHEQTAFIELAVASGHALLSLKEQNPMHTTSFGTGLLIRHAISQGLTRIYLFLGGSSTNDAGIGILHALGVDFYDDSDKLLPPTGASLSKIKRIDTSSLIDSSNAQFIVVSDVKNTMHGPKGAAQVYAKQKGASEKEVRILDQGLMDFASLIQAQYNKDVSSLEGGGAAGAIAAGLSALLPIDIRSGFEELISLLGLEPLFQNADIILTGEGRIDNQTTSGKVISGVCALAKKYNKPVYAFVGQKDINPKTEKTLGLKKVYSFQDVALSPEDSLLNSENHLRTLLHTFTSEVLAQ